MYKISAYGCAIFKKWDAMFKKQNVNELSIPQSMLHKILQMNIRIKSYRFQLLQTVTAR